MLILLTMVAAAQTKVCATLCTSVAQASACAKTCYSTKFNSTTDVDCSAQSRRRLSVDSLRTHDRSLRAGLERDPRLGRDTNGRQPGPGGAEFRESPRCNRQTGCACQKGR